MKGIFENRGYEVKVVNNLRYILSKDVIIKVEWELGLNLRDIEIDLEFD